MGLISTRALTGGEIRGAGGAAAATLALAGALLLWAPSSAAALSSACPGQDDRITAQNVASAETSLSCLINVYRQDNGLTAVTREGRLDAAARAHSQDMVNRNYFSHRSPEGKYHEHRIAAAGFPAGQTEHGENLACAEPATPMSLFESWRKSTAGHNETMLTRKWVVSGLGIVAGTSDECGFGGGATVTSLFATAPTTRRPPLEGCGAARAALDRSKQRVGSAKRAGARARARKRNARSPGARRKAARVLKRKKRSLARAKAAKRAARRQLADCLNQ